MALDPATVRVLREWRRRHTESERLAGAGVDGTSRVFTREDGTELHPERVSERFDRLMKCSGVPRLTLHGLRHTHATLALQAGVHPKVVQERLGHSSVAFTLDRYSHAIPAMQEDAASAVARGSSASNSAHSRQPGNRTIVYVDGFNLYYGALKGTPYRWLDLGALCTRLLPSDHVVAIKYFTAQVVPRPGKPQTAQRQQVYLRALETVPNLSIHYGHFLTRQVPRRLVKPPRRGSPTRLVWNTEEKGSDVNLASYLLIDGFRARYDLAVVISNDGDLKEPIRFVRDDLQAPVGSAEPTEPQLGAIAEPTPAWLVLQAHSARSRCGKPVRVHATRPERQLPQASRLVG